MQSKSDLRREMLKKRRETSAEAAAAESAEICRRLAAVLQERLAGVASPLVLSYLAYGREVNLATLHRELWRLGWRLAVPRTAGLAPGTMEAAAYGPQTELERTGLGVMEPVGSEFLAPEDIDAVLLPGVAFGEQGGRLGHGAGYYDRFLPRLRAGALLVGAAYDWQILADIPLEPWDRPVDLVVTERRVLGT